MSTSLGVSLSFDIVPGIIWVLGGLELFFGFLNCKRDIDDTCVHCPKEVQLGFFRCPRGCVLTICGYPWWGFLSKAKLSVINI